MQDIISALRDRADKTIIVITIFATLATIAVLLRFWATWKTKARYSWSEASLVFAHVNFLAQYAVEMHGLLEGKRMKTLSDPRLKVYIRDIYIAGEFYMPIILFTNISILLLYRRLFPIPSFELRSNILIIAHILWFIPSLVGETVLCSPPSLLWENPKEIPNKCIMYSNFFITMLTIELCLDIAILVLPLFYISTLRLLPWKRKAGLVGIFLLGGFVIVTGIVRIESSVELGVQVIDYVQDIFWQSVHAGSAIICACLPTYRPLVRRVTGESDNSGDAVVSTGGRPIVRAGGSGVSQDTRGEARNGEDERVVSAGCTVGMRRGEVEELELKCTGERAGEVGHRSF
ncbi:hypothetical protein DM02DRAFT_690581 [Periconia macrospinosa]|uniref:Rhodopsin domain-containing protein n=1 Tax=Periconia macrospinosa TaxID=97972 RepID=A0A2V1EDB0_9PLEO|nr:hypothetical protein DM02DRAFT_690581 [Periconia macrospinosa]